MVACSGTAPRWQVGRAAAVEKTLAGATSSLATLADAIAAVAKDVRPGAVADAEFLLGAAEGLLFEALVATLKPVWTARIAPERFPPAGRGLPIFLRNSCVHACMHACVGTRLLLDVSIGR
jgi:hypothetical protein